VREEKSEERERQMGERDAKGENEVIEAERILDVTMAHTHEARK
jgi:hypothetical protein